jgi:hypothetical protein
LTLSVLEPRAAREIPAFPLQEAKKQTIGKNLNLPELPEPGRIRNYRSLMMI